MTTSWFFERLFAACIIFGFLADPVFRTTGIAEVALVVLLLALLAVSVAAAWRARAQMVAPSWLLATITAAMASVCISALYGMVAGPSVGAAFRSSAPYLIPAVCLPLALAGTGARKLDARWLIGSIAFAGALQSGYNVALFVTSGATMSSFLSVLMHRITLEEARTTLPFFIAGAVLPVLAFTLPFPRWARITATAIIVLAILAAFVTLSRSHALTIVLALCGLAIVALFDQFLRRPPPERSDTGSFAVSRAIAMAGLVATLALLIIPGFNLLPGMLVLRTQVEFKADDQDLPPNPSLTEKWSKKSNATVTDEQRLSAHRSILQQEYDKSLAEGRAVDSRVLAELIELSTGKQRPGGGRMADEWLPAWNTYASASLIEKAIGIGAGRPFTTADGQLRTYIHNFPLYVLLYQGAIGLVLWVVLGTQLATTLFQRFRNNRDWPAIAMLVLWLALQFYGLTFAVHKLISFNLLLLAVYLMALGLVNDRLMPSADADEKSAAS